MKNMIIAEPMITVLSSIREDQCAVFDALCDDLLGSNAQ